MKARSLLLAITLLTFSSYPLACEPEKKQDEKKTTSFDEGVFDGARSFAEVLSTVGQKHYKISDIEECISKAIDAFLTRLDPHSSYLNAKKYKSIIESTSGEFFGIGIVIDATRQQTDKFLLIIDTIPDGPADSVGAKALDKIVEINGASLDGMTTEEAISKLKGERNSIVHVKILRENHPDLISVDIKRDSVKEQSSLCFYIEDQNIYYLSLTSFTENAAKQIEQLLNIAQKKECKALILDLRNNSGGLLNSAVDIAALFLDKGSEVASTKNKHNIVTDKHITKRDPITNAAMPIFILTNNYTASAAEILAGSLRIHSDKYAQQAGNLVQKKLMVFTAGTQSFGKGSVQEVIPISNGCAIKITTSLYFLPFDTAIQGIGIKPDFVIEKRTPPTDQAIWFNKYYGSEKALNHSIKLNNTDDENCKKDTNTPKKPDKEKSWSERAKETLSKDNQLREVISLINIFDASRRCCMEKVKNRTKAVEYLNKLYITDNALNLSEIKT